jgi:hypothetical protein
VSRIFTSHFSIDNAPAIQLRDWLVGEGRDDLFLDLDPERGIAAGERWERALNEAAGRCEAVLFLISKARLASRWCLPMVHERADVGAPAQQEVVWVLLSGERLPLESEPDG